MLRHRIYGDARVTTPGDVRFRSGGFSHSTENIGTDRSLWLPVQEERDGDLLRGALTPDSEASRADSVAAHFSGYQTSHLTTTVERPRVW